MERAGCSGSCQQGTLGRFASCSLRIALGLSRRPRRWPLQWARAMPRFRSDAPGVAGGAMGRHHGKAQRYWNPPHAVGKGSPTPGHGKECWSLGGLRHSVQMHFICIWQPRGIQCIWAKEHFLATAAAIAAVVSHHGCSPPLLHVFRRCSPGPRERSSPVKFPLALVSLICKISPFYSSAGFPEGCVWQL